MTTIHVQHRYPVPCDQLMGHFWQPELVEAKYQAVGASQVSVDASDSEIRSHRQVASEVPAALRSLLGSSNTIEQVEQWLQEDNGYDCQFEVKLAGVPITINGLMQWRDDDQGCSNTVTLKLRCAIPLVGKKLEAFVAQSSEAMIHGEHRYLLKQTTEAVDAD